MGLIHPSDMPILENAIRALIQLNGDRTVAADGLGDADIAALTNPATVSLLTTAVEALPGYHRADNPTKAILSSILKAAGLGMVPILAPTIGTVSTADSGGALVDATAYFYVVCAIDRGGRLSEPSAEGTVTTGAAGDDSVNTIPFTESAGGFGYRVFRGTATGVYGVYKDVTDVATASDAHPTTGWTALAATVTRAQLVSSASAAYGALTDDMVDDARDAGLFSTLLNALAALHPLGTAARTLPGGSVAAGNIL